MAVTKVGNSNWYQLSNGEKVQGKAKAEAAEAKLKAKPKAAPKPKGDGVAEVDTQAKEPPPEGAVVTFPYFDPADVAEVEAT